MKYFEVALLVFLLGMMLFIWAFFKHRLRRRFFQAVILRKISEFCQVNEQTYFFSNYIIRLAVNLILDAPIKIRNRFFEQLCVCDYKETVNYLYQKNAVIAKGLEAHFVPDEVFVWLKNQQQESLLILLMKGLFYAHENNLPALREIVGKLKPLRLSSFAKGIEALFVSRLALDEGDMFSASRHASLAVSAFKKNRAIYEEAEAYFLMGEIYRVCAVYDVAQMMFEAASMLYLAINNKSGNAKVLAAKGMILAGQNRFDEAADCFEKSKKIYHGLAYIKAEAEILNQQALMALLRKKYREGGKLAQKALCLHQKVKNNQGVAYSYELLAKSHFMKNKYVKVLELSQLAQKLYWADNNYSAYLDVMFVAAEATFKLKNFASAKKLCQKIIKLANKHSTCFHVANAYSLLGRTYIQLKDLKPAKRMLETSLNLEKLNQRDSVLVADYINLALVEKHLGNLNAARENLQKAKNEAQKPQNEAEKSQNEALFEIVNKEVEKIK